MYDLLKATRLKNPGIIIRYIRADISEIRPEKLLELTLNDD